MTQLPRAMLIDMDDTILSAYGRPEIAWNNVAAEFAAEFGPFTSQQVAGAVLDSARKFWAVAGAEWRMKLDEARHIGRRETGLPRLRPAATPCPRIWRRGSPTASRPIAKRKCSSSPAHTTPSTN